MFFRRKDKNKDKNKSPQPQSAGQEVTPAVPPPVAPPAASSVVDPAVVSPAVSSAESQPRPEAVDTAASAAAEAEKKSWLARFRRSGGAVDVPAAPPEAPVVVAPALAEEEPGDQKSGWFTRIKRGLSRTSSNFSRGLGRLILGKKVIDDDLLDEIETQLLVADVGIEATSDIIADLTGRVARKQLADSGALYVALKQALADLLKRVEAPLQLDYSKGPRVILVVGVNGVGKTTTIGKLARRLQGEGRKVMLAAGDTFRAAAVEQLQVWGERNQVPVVAQHTGADSASVIFDAIQSAQARAIDVVIADTAGRLHNKANLMEELSKVRRVMAKLDPTAPHEVLLVLDAGTGQNAINQAQQFIEAAGVTGLALTKLDGTAKGGVIFALSKKFGIPVRFIGVGEGIDDLQPFHADSFIDALFDDAD